MSPEREGLLLLAVLLSLIAVPLLAMSADQLVLGAARLAERIGVSSLVVGVVVIGLGTSAPELLVAGTAASSGHGSLTVGDLTGSNIVNRTFVLGVAGLVAPLRVRSSVVRREAPLAFGAVVVFAVLLLRGLDPVAGAISTVLLCGALVLVIRTSRSERADPVSAETEEYLGDPARHGLIWEAARTLLGVVGTLAGARLLVVNAASIAVRLGARQEAVGFTLVALGTSLPELVTALQAQRRGEPDLLVGTLLGSSLINSLAGGAVIGFLTPRTVGIDTPAILLLMVAVTGIAWVLLARGRRLSRPESLILTGIYLIALPLLI